MRFAARALGVAGVLGASVAFMATACTSFSEPTASPDAGATDDAGGTTDGAVGDATGDDGGVARGCPATLPPNSVCFDFSGPSVPNGDQSNGDFALDPAEPWSAPSSLAASTTSNAGGAYAYLSQTIAGVPKKVSFDQYVRVSSMPTTEIGEISVRGPARYYAILFNLTGNNLEVYDSIHDIGGGPISGVAYQLGTIPTDVWVRLTLEVELAGFDTASPRRKLTAKVDGLTKLTDDGPVPGLVDPLGATETRVEIGITWAGEEPSVPRKMNVDDVRIDWTP